MTFLLYLGKVMLCSGLLLGYYWLFLRNRRFHHYNRFYLQATLLFSVIMPFIRIPVWNKPQNRVNQVMYQTLEVLTVNYGEEDGLQTAPGTLAKLVTLENMLYLLYGAGIMILLWTLLRSLLYIRKISKKYPFERIGELKFFTTREPNTPFSFFRSIFWNNDLPFNSRDGQQIFRHELFHVQQKHSTDIMLTEIITAFFWFNPFFHLLKKELKAIHEFLADRYAISDSDRYAYAELLVLQTLKAKPGSLANHFFQNHIKRRIAMITNNQFTRSGYRSRLMALPVLALVFCTVALYAQRSANTLRNIYFTGSNPNPVTVVIDAGHGGPDAGAYSKDGRVTEKDLTLQISRKIQQLAPSYNVKVVMTRTDNNLPRSTSEKNQGLKARTEIAQNAKADLFVAIHVAAAEAQQTADNGFEVYVSRNENSNTQQARLYGAAIVQELSKLYQTNTALLQRKSKGIWVLDQSPCPAVLIECGYITNEKDLAFISNSSNQEAVAKKILEGIVNSKNTPAAATNTPATPQQRVAKAVPVTKPAPAATPARQVIHASVELTAAQPQPVAQPASQEPGIDKPGDSVIKKIVRHYLRNARYPQQARVSNGEGIVYFSMAVDKNGGISNLQFFDEAPAEASRLNKMVTVGYASASEAPVVEQISRDEIIKLLQEEVKRIFEKKPDLSNGTPQAKQYFFQMNFRVEKEHPETV